MDTAATLNVAQAAEMMFADADTVMALARQGKLPGAKIGKSWVFLRSDVLEFLRSRIRDETDERIRRQRKAEAPLALKTEPSVRSTRRRPIPALPSVPTPLSQSTGSASGD